MIDLDSGQLPRRQGYRRQTRVSERHDVQARRDDALRRVARVRHVAIAVAAGLSAGLAGLVADVSPGKSYSSKRGEGGAALGVAAKPADAAFALPPLATARELGLKAASTPSVASGAGPGGGSSTAVVTPAVPTPAAPAAPVVQAPAPAVQAPAVSGGS